MRTARQRQHRRGGDVGRILRCAQNDAVYFLLREKGLPLEGKVSRPAVTNEVFCVYISIMYTQLSTSSVGLRRQLPLIIARASAEARLPRQSREAISRGKQRVSPLMTPSCLDGKWRVGDAAPYGIARALRSAITAAKAMFIIVGADIIRPFSSGWEISLFAAAGALK